MKRIFHSLLLFSILAASPAQGFDIPGLSSKTLKLKAKIIGENLSSLFSYQNQAQAIKLYRQAEFFTNLPSLIVKIAKGIAQDFRNNSLDPLPEDLITAFKKLGMKPYDYAIFDVPQPDLNRSSNISFDTSFSGLASATSHLNASQMATTKQERMMLMGHHLVAIRDNHALKQLGVSLALPLLSAGIILISSEGLEYSFKKAAQLEYLQKYPKVLGVLQTIKNATKVTIESPLFNFFCIEGTKAMLSRYLQKSADIQAAQALDCADGGISFFNKCIENEKNKTWTAYLNPEYALHNLKETIGLSTHPAPEERIQYLTQLAKGSQ